MSPTHETLLAADAGDELGGGVVFGIADNGHAPAALDDGVALGNVVGGVVGALGVDVGTDFADQGAHVGLGKHDHGVHVGEGGQNFGALGGGHQRTPGALQAAHRLIRIETDHEFSAELLGGAEIADVADVQQVETAVGQDDALAGAAPFLDAAAELIAGKDFVFVRAHQKDLTADLRGFTRIRFLSPDPR